MRLRQVAKHVAFCVALMLGVAISCSGQDSPVTAVGLTLQALSDADLDTIEAKSGHRVGVLVAAVAADSPAAAAGLKAGDILFLVAEKPVASPDEVAKALTGKTGEVRVGGLRAKEDGEGEVFECRMTIPANTATPTPAAAQPPADIQEKLKALDAAFAAGVITKEELDRKKAELQAQAKPAAPDAQTAEKLKALDDARRAGVISEAEYQQKRAALLGGTGTAGAATPPAKTSGDALTAYLDMLDFMRSQAWAKELVTPAADRQRLLALLQGADEKTRQNVAQGLQGVPQLWADLRKKWAEADDQKKAEQRDHWRKQLLRPTFVYPPPLETETFRGRNDRVVFEHPKGWVVAQTEDEGTQYLYLGPPGTQTTWAQVLDPAQCPPGALFAIMPVPDELKNVKYTEGARMVAQQYVCPPGVQMTELSAEPLGEGAILTLRGKYPGQAEERFYWVGLIKYGTDYVMAGRLGGPIARADQLVPVFANMIMTMALNPPEGDGGYGAAYVDYYTSRLGNIVAGASWH